MSVVKFDYAHFIASFPHLKFSSLTPEAIDLQWAIAVEIVGNDDAISFAPYEPEQGIFERRTLLYLALAHMLQLDQANAGGINGRLSSVSEGSVSISITPFTGKNAIAEYWLSTPEGAKFWLLTGKYRRGGMLAKPINTFHPWT